MPPRPTFGAAPVRFDHHVADQAIAALEELAASLRGLLRVDHELQHTLRQDWCGPARIWFDVEHGATVASVQRSIARAIDGAETIRRAKHLAAVEQHRRNVEAAVATAAALVVKP